MANINNPFGLVPVNDTNGKPWSGAVRYYYHAADNSQAVYIGDLVTITGATTMVMIGGVLMSIPNVTQSATGDVFQGVCTGTIALTRDTPIYGAASTGVILAVCDDPDTLFLVQDISTGTALTPNDIGLNINVTVNQGSTVTGVSGMVLNNASEAGTNTLDLKIVGQYLTPDNELGADASTGAASGRWLVRINRHRFANQVAGA